MEPLRLAMPPPGSEVWVESDPGQSFALEFSPEGMRFERVGSDLYVIAPDGAHLIIARYFAGPELAPFFTENGRLVSGADYLMIMNPYMDISVPDAFGAPKKGRSSFFSPPEKPWDEENFSFLQAGDDILDFGCRIDWTGTEGAVPDYVDQSESPGAEDSVADHGYHDEWRPEQAGPIEPEAEACFTDNDNVRYWIGEDARQWHAWLREIEGSISVSLITPPGAATEAFLAYVALIDENSSLSEHCGQADSESEYTLYQDGPMGKAGISLRRESTGDTLVMLAEVFYSFQAYFGGWLSVMFSCMMVEGIEILMNAPSGQSVVDLQDYFGHAVFSDVPIAWLYDESPKVAGNLAEFADEGFNLADLLDALELEQEGLADPHPLPDNDSPLPRVENVVLVRADTNDVIKLPEEWDGDEAVTNAACSVFTLDEQTLLIHGEILSIEDDTES